MSEQEREENQPVGTGVDAPAGVGADRTRRRLTAAGLGAPVIMTLASRPVFGAQCLSNMMSGNLSDPNRGTCQSGFSPGAWGNPGGMILNLTTLQAWTTAGLDYGTLRTGANRNQAASYTGGTKVSQTPFVAPPSAPNNVTCRDVIRNYNNEMCRSWLVAYLNAKLSENYPTFRYVMTPAQVVQLATSGIVPPGYTDMKTFLHSTWDFRD